MRLSDIYHNDVKLLRKRIDANDSIDLTVLSDTKENREIMYAKTTPLVHHLSRLIENRYGKSRLYWDDLIQSGNYGLLIAIDNWFKDYGTNKSKWNEFHSFAYIWVYKHIMEYVENNLSILTHGVHDVKNVLSNTKITSCDIMFDDNDGDGDGYVNIIDLYNSDSQENNIDIDLTENITNMLSKFLTSSESELLLHYYNIKGDMDSLGISESLGIKPNNLRVKISRIIDKIKNNMTDSEANVWASVMV